MLRTRVLLGSRVRHGPGKVFFGFHLFFAKPGGILLEFLWNVLRGLRGGPGWFEVRLYEGFRVPQDSTRAMGPEVSQDSTKLCKDSTRVP